VAFAAPLPAVAERSRSRLWAVPVYWHLLSFDAPTVAVLWAWSFARTIHVQSSLTSLAVLGIGTWAIYVADRLLDGRFSPHHDLRERHFFHARHRRAFLMAAILPAAALLGLISVMPSAARREDAVIFGLSMLYFASVHLPALRVRRWFPREVAVGIVFACATAIPAWSGYPSASTTVHAQLAWLVLLFAGLCTLNCVAIETWERPGKPAHNNTVSVIAMCLAAASAALLFIPSLRTTGVLPLLAALITSAILLLALDHLHRRASNQGSEDNTQFLLSLRIAADAALLTPLLFVLLWHP
jgi:hypothetical protein